MTSDTDMRTVVGFYGGQFKSERLESLYSSLVTWFDGLDGSPDKLGVHGGSFNGKVGAFRTNDSKLRKSGFDGVEGFSLYSLTPGGEVPLWDWQFSAEVTAKSATCAIGASPSTAPLPGDALLSISTTVVKTLAPSYGIGFQREMRLGPTMYVTGLVQGLQPWGDEKPEGEKIEAWKTGIKNKVYEQGILRDVYPWNFLTDLQLSRQIEGKSLKQWIKAHPEFGTLSAVAENMYVWEIPGSQISRVCSVLQNARIVFDVASATFR